jgi:hypothetical protein
MRSIIKMKLTLLIIASLFFVACQENIIGDFGTVLSGDQIIDSATELPGKKGIAFTNNKRAWSHKTSALTPHWMYSWGNDLREEIPENVEFVPMFWGRGSVTDANLERVKQLIDEGKVKYVLGFNEPDGESQANMTVQEALDLWPKLEALGVPLGSPATVSPDNPWMLDFMAKAQDLGLRIDFVAVHHYGGASTANFISKISNAHNNFELPVWVTEFAVADWSAAVPQDNRYTEAQVMDFMRESLQALEQIEWVHRYTWFDGQNAPLYTSALYDEDEVITPVGQLYADIAGNSIIGAGVDTDYVAPVDLDNLILNGNFEDGSIVPWLGFKMGFVGSSTTEPFVGNFSGRIENGDGSLYQVITVTPGSNYTLKFHSKWSENITNTFTPIIRDHTVNGSSGVIHRLPDVPMTDTWIETIYQFQVPADVSIIRVVFYKSNGFPPFFLDDITLKEN